MTPEQDRYYVLGNVLEGLALLEATPAFTSLLPEIRSNLVMALETARGPEDVVGIPGRITAVAGSPRAAGRPTLGASRYTALIVLAARRARQNLRAGIEIRYRPDLVEEIRAMGLEPAPLEGLMAATADREALAQGLARAFGQAYSEPQRISVAYTEGGHAREGAIILLGETAVEVARRAIDVAEAHARGV